MKKMFEKWENETENIEHQVNGWLRRRGLNLSPFGEENVNQELHSLLLAELSTRVVADAANLAPAVLDVVFKNPYTSQTHTNPDATLSKILNRCFADDDLSVLPIILNSVNKNVLSNCTSSLLKLAKQIMASPDKFRQYSADFTPNTQNIMLPYCLTVDPYNASFISERWNIAIDRKQMWRTILVATKNLSDLEALKGLRPIANLMDVSDVLWGIETSIGLIPEFQELAVGVKNARDNQDKPFDVKKWSYSLRLNEKKETMICDQWLKMLSFPTPSLDFNDRIAFNAIAKFTHNYGVSFASLQEKIEEHLLKTLAPHSNHLSSRARKL